MIDYLDSNNQISNMSSLEEEQESFLKVVTNNIMTKAKILNNDPNYDVNDPNNSKSIEFNEEIKYYKTLLQLIRSSNDIQYIIELKTCVQSMFPNT